MIVVSRSGWQANDLTDIVDRLAFYDFGNGFELIGQYTGAGNATLPADPVGRYPAAGLPRDGTIIMLPRSCRYGDWVRALKRFAPGPPGSAPEDQVLHG